jgi:hypothetical protein
MSFTILNIYEGDGGMVHFQIHCKGGWRRNSNNIELTPAQIANAEVDFKKVYSKVPNQGSSTATFRSNLKVGDQLRDWELFYPDDPEKEVVAILTTEGGDGSDRRMLQKAYKKAQASHPFGWRVVLPGKQPIFVRRG